MRRYEQDTERMYRTAPVAMSLCSQRACVMRSVEALATLRSSWTGCRFRGLAVGSRQPPRPSTVCTEAPSSGFIPIQPHHLQPLLCGPGGIHAPAPAGGGHQAPGQLAKRLGCHLEQLQ